MVRTAKIFLFFLIIHTAVAAAAVGTSPKNPVRFSHIADWLGDSRASLKLFEQTLYTDMLAFRLKWHFFKDPAYVKLSHGNGKVYETRISHATFQAMFWGPLYAATVWTVPAFTTDLVIALMDDSGEYNFPLTKLPWKLFMPGLKTLREQSDDSIPVPELFRINVLFTSDVMLLDFRHVSAPDNRVKKHYSMLGKNYMGLSFKFLNNNYLFTGFSFIYYPHIYGYHNFKGGDYAGSESIMVYGTASGEDALTDTSFANFRYETRAKFFLTSNILDLFQLRSLFNIANALDSLDSLGGGLTFNREGRLKFHTYLSYLHLLKTAAWDSHFSVKSGGFYFYIDYDFLLKPFSPLQELKGGIRIVKPVSERRWGTIALYLNGRGSTYRQNEERKYGWLASAGLLFPLSMKFIFGAGYNTDPTMAKLPLGNDNLMFFFRIEVGMNRNFSPSFTPVYREHFL